MRRAAWDVKVDRNGAVRAVVNLPMVDIGSAGDRTGADGDDDLRGGNGVVRLLEREPHVLGDRPGDKQAVGVARGGHVLDAQPTEVEDDRPQNVHVSLAAVATTGAHNPELEGSPE